MGRRYKPKLAVSIIIRFVKTVEDKICIVGEGKRLWALGSGLTFGYSGQKGCSFLFFY